MKTLAASAAVLGIWTVLGSQAGDTGSFGQNVWVTYPKSGDPISALAAADRSASAPTAADLSDVIEDYCVRCHNQRRMTGNLSLESFDVESAHESAETAERVIRKLRAGMMPPVGANRPVGDTLLSLVERLETVVDEAAAANPNPGVRRFQRLNRPEYERVILDLLDLEVDAGAWLPADTYLGSFDNLSAAQGLSTTLLEGYLRAATEISRMAVGNPNAVSGTSKYDNPIEVSQHAWDHIEGTPFGTRGGMVVTHTFPADGEYVFTVETLLGAGIGFEDLDISVDGEGVALLGLEHSGGRSVPMQTEPVFVTAGQHDVSAAFVRKIDGPYEDRHSPFDWSLVGGEDATGWANYGITGLPHLAELMVTGPSNPTGVSETASRRKVFSCYPSTSSEERACAESIIRRLATDAYRRPVADEDLSGPMMFYDEAAAEEGFEIGVRTALQLILSSPYFLYRLERAPSETGPGETYRLSDIDLASRLSFFLWGTVPDAELRAVAAEGGLSNPRTLEAQLARMVADPRSEALATRFAAQWLRLQDVVKNQPEPYFYPDFTRQLGDAMVRETELLFHDLVVNDRSLLDLFTADYTYVNEDLARHYGIEGVAGSEFRRVEYPNDQRKGLLGHGSVLVLTSLSDRTSPVIRGKWVMEVLMGTPPPPPPPNVPTLSEIEGARGGRVLTTRERMELHRQNPTCNSCHSLIDPIGLALDNYDVTGKWRIRENGMPLDTRGEFFDGSPINNPTQLTDALMKRPISLTRNFTTNLLAYAMGRRVEYYDQPAIREIVREAEANDYRMSSFILGVVRSAPFQMMRSEASEEAGAGQ